MMLSHKHFIVTSFIFISCSLSVHATDHMHGWGKVNMQGSIIDTACAIATESREQLVDIGVVPVADIIRTGQSRSWPLAIKLVNCTLVKNNKSPEWRQFQITFDGDSEGNLFNIHGISGVGLQITDIMGRVAKPGKAFPLEEITPGDMQLNYAIKLVANNHELKVGDYFSTIRFKLDYF